MAQSAPATREGLWAGSPAAMPSKSSGKSPAPPGVGSAQTSSSRKSGISSWMRQGRAVWVASGTLIVLPTN